MKKQQQKKSWNPVQGISKVVDGIVDKPQQSRQQTQKMKPQTKVERERVVLYLTPTQAYNLRKAALDRHMDTSAIAREIFKKAGV